MVNWKAGAVLLALLVGLGVYAFQSRPQGTPDRPRLMPCDAFNTVRASFTGGGGSMVLERAKTGDPWRIAEPRPGPADKTQVEFILNGISSVTVQNTIQKADQGGDAYGFQSPHVVVTCRVNNGASYTLTVGKKSFDASGYYARKSGDVRVYVISAVEVDGFDKAITEPPVPSSPVPSGASPSP